MHTSKTIRAARDLVANGHTNEPAEFDADGRITKVCAATALAMAMTATTVAGNKGAARRAYRYVAAQCGGLGLIPTFSRTHTQAEVVAMFERAAEEADKA